jgi:hypothetical protein
LQLPDNPVRATVRDWDLSVLNRAFRATGAVTKVVGTPATIAMSQAMAGAFQPKTSFVFDQGLAHVLTIAESCCQWWYSF